MGCSRLPRARTAEALSSAKTYTDAQSATTLSSAKSYTDQAVSGVQTQLDSFEQQTNARFDQQGIDVTIMLRGEVEK